MHLQLHLISHPITNYWILKIKYVAQARSYDKEKLYKTELYSLDNYRAKWIMDHSLLSALVILSAV